jgi:hypothetical protein
MHVLHWGVVVRSRAFGIFQWRVTKAKKENDQNANRQQQAPHEPKSTKKHNRKGKRKSIMSLYTLARSERQNCHRFVEHWPLYHLEVEGTPQVEGILTCTSFSTYVKSYIPAMNFV